MTIAAIAMLALLPAQQISESGTFTVAVEGVRVGTERFSISRTASGYLATARTEIESGGRRVVADSRMTLDDALRPLIYEYESGENTLRLVVGDPVSEVSVSSQEASLDIRIPAGGAVVDDNFFHHYLLLLHRIGVAGGSLPVFVPQQMTLGTLEVRAMGEGKFQIRSENLLMEATVDANGRLLRLTVPEAGVVVSR